MDADQTSNYVVRKFLNYEKICFDKCVEKPEKKFSIKEENCLRNCSVKILNALDFMHGLNEKGGVDRQDYKKNSSLF